MSAQLVPDYRRRYPYPEDDNRSGLRAERCKTFMSGYPNRIKNVSQYDGGRASIHTTYQHMTPDISPPKTGSGDYGPIQFTDYYLQDGTHNPYNPTYPYPPDWTITSNYSYKRYQPAIGENQGRCCNSGKINYYNMT